MSLKVAVIGGGAAGFFAAISCKQHHPQAEVAILEKTDKLLSKVKISGGGRCNVTHACFTNSQLVKFYPRGEKPLRKLFNHFSTQDTVDWYEARGVQLKVEADNRMFPVTDSSQTIIDCLLSESKRLGVLVRMKSAVKQIKRLSVGFELQVNENTEFFDKVIVASGGSPKLAGFDWLATLGYQIVPPVPSLFTFNMPGNPVRELMGLSVPNAQVKVQGTKLVQSGPLLITHWGMSGPAILKTSAWGARILHDLNYQFVAQVNWLEGRSENDIRDWLTENKDSLSKRKIRNKNPFEIPNRLWEFLLKKVELDPEQTWQSVGKKGLNRLINVLVNDAYQVNGKTTFKEEFVTSGGVALADINFNTMQSRRCTGLYFAGEVMDVDGVTGGFNFQAAWSSGYIAGKLLKES
jgi:predicted Rossmann fold flavoprotein